MKLTFSKLQKSIQINVTSCIALVSSVLKRFSGKCQKLDLINISSLAAIKPFESWGIYCSAKASRDMIIQVVAVECESKPNSTDIKSLNYAPGPVNTDMQKQIYEKSNVPNQSKVYEDMLKNNQLLTPKDTAKRLISILEQRSWINGSHIDYYDQ